MSVADLMPASSPSVDFDQLDLVASRCSAQRAYMRSSICGPVLALGAAGAGMDFEIGVVGVGLAGEQRLDLRGARPRPAARGSPPRPRRRWPRRPRPRRARSASTASSSSCSSRLMAAICVLERGALAHDLLRALRRRSRGRDPRRGRSARRGGCWALSQSKMPPQQPDGLLDLVDEVARFRRAWSSSVARCWRRSAAACVAATARRGKPAVAASAEVSRGRRVAGPDRRPRCRPPAARRRPPPRRR